MPLYEYECDGCGRRFELIRKFSDPPVTSCPTCEGPVRKLLSSPAIQFKGTGWYITDYARKPSAGQAAAAKSDSESKDSKEKSSPDAKAASTESSSKPSSGKHGAASSAGKTDR
ncbi:MAG: hypothetical protein J4F30_07550 [Acidobacteria bacterium]|nr:hypothetical protein [Acidobacteriota bacterium]